MPYPGPLDLSRDKTDYVLCRVIWVIRDLDYCKGRFKCDSVMPLCVKVGGISRLCSRVFMRVVNVRGVFEL